jgi:hypothetical protein
MLCATSRQYPSVAIVATVAIVAIVAIRNVF